MHTTARFFNTTGPCDPAMHFMLPTEPRVPEVRPLIAKALYFVLHAPRQSGKTTWMASQVYQEVAFQLVVMSFLQRMTNGDGRIDREYAIGRGRMDLCIHWP